MAPPRAAEPTPAALRKRRQRARARAAWSALAARAAWSAFASAKAFIRKPFDALRERFSPKRARGAPRKLEVLPPTQRWREHQLRVVPASVTLSARHLRVFLEPAPRWVPYTTCNGSALFHRTQFPATIERLPGWLFYDACVELMRSAIQARYQIPDDALVDISHEQLVLAGVTPGWQKEKKLLHVQKIHFALRHRLARELGLPVRETVSDSDVGLLCTSWFMSTKESPAVSMPATLLRQLDRQQLGIRKGAQVIGGATAQLAAIRRAIPPAPPSAPAADALAVLRATAPARLAAASPAVRGAGRPPCRTAAPRAA